MDHKRITSIVLWGVLMASQFITTDLHGQDFERLKLAADSAFEASDYTLALERYSDLIKSYSKAGQPKDETYHLSLFRNLDCLIIAKKFDEAEVMQNEISTEVFGGDGQAYQANYHFLKAKLLLRGKRAYQASYNEYQLAYKMKVGDAAPSKLRAETAHELAVILTRYLNKNDSAIYYYNLAKSDHIELSGEVSNEVANELGFMAQTYYNMRELPKNMEFLKRSVTTFARVIDPEVLTRIPTSKGYDSLNVFLKGLAKELNHEKFIQKLPKNSIANIANLGNGLIDQTGNLNLGEDYLNLAMKLNLRFVNVTGTAGISQGLAGIYYRRNQFQFALDYFDQAEKYYKMADMENPAIRDQVAWIYLNKGFLYETIGKLDSAMVYQEKGLKIRKSLAQEPFWAIGFSYFGLGLNAYALGEYEEALGFFDKAEFNQFPYPGQLTYSRAEVFREMEQPDSALYHFRKSIDTFYDKQDVNYNLYLNTFGSFWTRINELDSAIRYFDRSILNNQKELETNKLTDLSDMDIQAATYPIILLYSLGGRAEAFQLKYEQNYNIQDLITALEQYELAKDLIAHIRTSFVQEVDNIQFNQIIRETIEGAIDVCLKLAEVKEDNSYVEQAFQMIDMGRSQIMMDAIKTRQLRESPVNEDLASVSELKKEIRNQESLLQELILNKAADEEIQDSNDGLLLLQNALTEKLSEIKDSQPNMYKYLSDAGSTFSVEELRSYAIDNNSTIVEYFWGDEGLYAALLNEDELSVIPLNNELEELSIQLSRFKAFLKSNKNVSKAGFNQFAKDGHLLYQTLIGSIAEKTAEKDLILIPDGPLSNLPFEVLLTSEVSSEVVDFKNLPYLIKEKKTDYVSSASILLENLKNYPSKNLQDFAAWAPFSDPEKLTVTSRNTLRDEGLESLPGSGRELETLASVFDGINFTGNEATEQSFKANVNRAKVIHIATHGIINDQQTVLSNLLFNNAKETPEDNRLYMFEIYGMSLNTELAVLTACNTGSGKQEQGEGTISLARAFKYAGAKSVLMSLWLANDQSTSDVIGDFYRNLADEQTKGEALRNAKLKYLNQADNLAAHPFYWSHLILSGDSAPIRSSGFPTLWILIALGLLTLAFLGFRRHKKPVS